MHSYFDSSDLVIMERERKERERLATGKHVAIIGSSQYKDKFFELKAKLENDGCVVFIPAFDDLKHLDDLGVCEYNRKIISEAEIVYIIWDNRSTGTLFDFGMAFGMGKKVEIAYLEEKTFAGVMKKYEKKCKNPI
ncbi:nucleoside 2-deoxyribosyltransferase [Candidatus Pacearchaeota archaeon]|nr:nucleoside 2-deoxyribosyltransferase [Candidatus Pacearchaeota archaeon]